LTCGFWVAVLGSCCELIFAGEPVEDGSAADLVVGEVDRLWGMGLGLGWCKLSERSVWACGVEVVQIRGEDPA
jgi:hypothetical protein